MKLVPGNIIRLRDGKETYCRGTTYEACQCHPSRAYRAKAPFNIFLKPVLYSGPALERELPINDEQVYDLAFLLSAKTLPDFDVFDGFEDFIKQVIDEWWED